jgi:hypothetical protein
VDLAGTGLFSNIGDTASAQVIQSASQLIGGQYAQGQLGDVLIQNDRIRAIIQQPGRTINPVLYGGILIDADVQRPAGEPGHDQFGRMGPLYAFGRTVNVTQVDVLNDGSAGGYAVVAATGQDALNNYAHISLVLSQYLGSLAQLTIDPDTPLPLLVTTYYVLSPGESRVRMLTAFCNQGSSSVVIPVGDLTDIGGTVDYFNPQACTHTFGNEGCLVDPAPWYGLQGNDGVAYGFRSYEVGELGTPTANGIISVVGIIATIAGAQDESGVLSWLDPDAQTRPGSLGVHPGSQNLYLRDFVVGQSMADITSFFTDIDNLGHARLSLSVTNPDGSTAPGARVAVVDPTNATEVTATIADDQGNASMDLPTAGYQLFAALPGHAIPPGVSVQLPTSGTLAQALQLGAANTLTVTTQDENGAPLPAKVTVLCPSGTCPQPQSTYQLFWDQEQFPTNVADIELVPPSGTLTFPLAPGQYQIVVTHGPEYSTFPDSWPIQGYPVDLTTSNQTVAAMLGHVVDTTGWISADLHVHAVDSSDSSVPNERRVMSFLGEGVAVIVATDHDFITDYNPTIESLQAGALLVSVPGDELSTFDFGHYNLYPLPLGPANAANGGAFDWGAPDNVHVMRLPDIFNGVRQQWPDALIQINHARGTFGSLTKLEVDTATGASHVDPSLYRLEPAPGATADNTLLFSDNYDTFEVQNGLSASAALLNDWMTFISRGAVKTATAVSDSHYTLMYGAGDSRTFIQTGYESPTQFDTGTFTQALKAHHAFGTNGPFVRVQAQRLDASGAPVGTSVGIGDTVSVNPDAGETLNLNVDVEAAEWVNFDTIEVYSFAPGRESTNGVENDTWPSALATQNLSLATLPIEAVPGSGSQTFRRIHVNTNFVVSPTADTWYAVMVRGSSAANTLFPMVMHGVSCSGALCTPQTSQAFAFTNPIYVDGDGDGTYDHFPLPSAPPPAPAPRHPPKRDIRTLRQRVDDMLRDIRAHHCGG